jgi:beta-lactamase class D
MNIYPMKLNAAIFIGLFALLTACSPNNVKSDVAIGKILDSAGLYGSFAILDNGTEQFVIHNLAAYKDSAVAPLNTFFILPTLVAIEKGIMSNNTSTWINLDSTTAYQGLIQKLGRPTLLKVIDSLHYGKGIVSADMTQFWSDNSLKITPDEQLGLIKRLYFNQLYFQKRSQDIVKKMLVKEDNASYKLSYIASTVNKQSWILGYIEENKHVYFFVLSTESLASDNIANKNANVLKAILLQQGFLKGRR